MNNRRFCDFYRYAAFRCYQGATDFHSPGKGIFTPAFSYPLPEILPVVVLFLDKRLQSSLLPLLFCLDNPFRLIYLLFQLLRYLRDFTHEDLLFAPTLYPIDRSQRFIQDLREDKFIFLGPRTEIGIYIHCGAEAALDRDNLTS